MNELKIFENQEFGQVRVINMNGEPYFVLKDVCDVLGIQNTTDVAKRLDEDEVTRFNLGGLSGETNIINESGLYNVILRSDKPQAKQFKKWVTSEILPSIRKHGAYMAGGIENLSPQLQLLINIELKQKEQDRALADTNARIDGIKDIVSLDSKSWRQDAKKLIAQIALARGGYGYMGEVQSEIYTNLDSRFGVSLEIRLTNKRRRMAEEGVSKSTRDKLSKVDIIAEDKKIVEGYIAIIKEMAVKYGIADLRKAI